MILTLGRFLEVAKTAKVAATVEVTFPPSY
jgi:hypothetical protein